MGVLDKLIELRGQSHKPRDIDPGPGIVPTNTDIAVEMGGRHGVSGPETWKINKRLENPELYSKPTQDMSVEGFVDLQILDPQTKIQIKTGVRNRIKRVLSFLGD